MCNLSYLYIITKKQYTMKLFNFLFLVLTLNLYSQPLMIVGTNVPYESEFITFKDIDSLWIEVSLLNVDTNASEVTYGINELVVMDSLLSVINKYRVKHGSTELTFNKQIYYDLRGSMLFGFPSSGVTWSLYGTFSNYGVLSQFNNKEVKFCQYLIDMMTISEEQYLDLINPNVTEVGFYFTENIDELTYDFSIHLK